MEAILTRRAEGERVTLPTDPAPASQRRLFRWIVVIAAGAAASVAVARRLFPPATDTTPPDAASQQAFYGVGLLYAQATDRPTFPVIRSTRPLTPGTWRYVWADGPATPVDTTEEWRQERSTDSYEGVAAYRYRYGKRNRAGQILLTDTLWLNHESLRPLARVAGTLTGGHVTQIFKENSVVTGHTTSGGMTEWISREYDSLGPYVIGRGRMPAGLIGIPGPVSLWRPQISAVLEAADLGPDWRGSMEALVVPQGFLALRFWLNFQVVGEERITVPAGTFDAWKIQVGQKARMFAWVSKHRQWLLRLGSEQGESWHGQQLLVEGAVSGEQ